MKIKPNSKTIKFLSVLLSLAMVLSTFPMAFAAGEKLTIQYLNDGVVQEGVSLKLKANENGDVVSSGTTDKKGVWETSVTWAELSQTFVVYINDDAKIVEKSDEEKSFLIIDRDEKTWANSVASLESVKISADKTSVLRGETIKLTAEVKGTPDSYQWYFNGNEIEGATSADYQISSANLSNGGRYECRVTDPIGNARTSDGITLTVSNEEITNAVLKAFSNGVEISGAADRKTVREIELLIEGIPSDAKIENVKFYVNDNCDNYSNTETGYTFEIKDGVETYECKAVLTFLEKYAETTVELSNPIQLDMVEQDALVIKTSENVSYDNDSQAYSITYSADPKTEFYISVSGGSGSGEYSIGIIEEKDWNGDSATVVKKLERIGTENEWKVTVKAAGTFKIVVSKAGDGDYAAAESVTKKVVVNKAMPQGFAFENLAPEAVVYNTNGNEFVNKVPVEFDNVTYSVVAGDCAVINDETSGTIRILKAGTVTVKATMAASDNYLEATAEYTLTVKKATQTIKFEDMIDTIYYGQPYKRAAAPVAVAGAADGYGYNNDADASIVYSIVVPDGETAAIAQVEQNGNLLFASGKTGTVTVKAELAENDCYESATAEYTLIVEEYAVENGYSISGEKDSEDNEWYKSDITIKPAEKHLISLSDNLDDSNGWLESIVISQDGSENGCDIYLKNVETGAISKAYSIANEDLKRDTKAPEKLAVRFRTAAWYEPVLDNITFGYYNAAVVFVLEASDVDSGVKSFTWKFTPEEEGGNSVAETTVEAFRKDGVYQSDECVLGDENDLKEFRGKISFSVIDNAGNKAEYNDNYVIVVDNAETEISMSTDITPVEIVNSAYPHETATSDSADPVEIYDKAVTATFTITEKNFFPERASVTVNGVDVSDLTWDSKGDTYVATVKFDESGDYRVRFAYESIFGNNPDNITDKEVLKISKFISIDKDDPVISVSLNDAAFEDNSVKYYNSDVTATISVKEAKFRPAELTVGTIAGFAGISEENIAYLRNNDSWTADEATGTYTATITFKAKDVDNNYKFAIGYTDIVGNAAESVESESFVIDTRVPVIDISNNGTVKNTVINKYPYANAEKGAADSIEIYSDNTTAVITITEKNFFEDRAVVTVNGEVADVKWIASEDKNTAEILFDKDGDYEIVVSYTDIFGASDSQKDEYTASKSISVDKTAPVINIALSEPEHIANAKKYYDSDVTATIFVKEAKFRPTELAFETVSGYSGISEENAVYLKDSKNWTFDKATGTYNAKVVFASKDADDNYKFAVGYTDIADNYAEKVESETFVIDTKLPLLSVSNKEAPRNTVFNKYPYVDAEKGAADSIEIYNDNTTAVITITEKNFFEDRAIVKVNGETVSVKWTSSAGKNNAEILFDKDGDYEIVVSYIDIFGANAKDTQKAEYKVSKSVSVDKTAPAINIALSTPKYAEGATKYYNSDAKVVISVKDAKFRPAEIAAVIAEGYNSVDSLSKENISNAANWKYNSEKGVYEYSFTVSAAAKEENYKFSVGHTDLAGHKAKTAESDKFVIDINKPIISASYGEASLLDSENNIVTSFELSETDNILVFDTSSVSVTFTVDEKNFAAKDAVLYVSEDGGEFKPLNFDGEWNTQGGISQNTVTIKEQGTYRLKLVCSDLCTNMADEYFTPKIIIDDTVPTVLYKIDAEGPYYYDDKSVDIFVNVFDKNFSAQRMKFAVKAKNLSGKDVGFAETIPNITDSKNWTKNTKENGSEYYSFKITLSTEAIYSLDTTYTDAVGKEISADRKFVLDRTAPKNLGISYSVPKLHKLVSVITFNYYNAPITMTLTADDEISGIRRIDWKYTKEAGASTTNVESLEGFFEYETAVVNGELVVTIPVTTGNGSATLADIDQLRGNISLVVTDAAGNLSKFGYNDNGTDENNTIVVDTITPTREIKFSAPTLEANGNLYYKYYPTVTINITEANFYPEDVILSINDKPYNQLKWTQNGDLWTAPITISTEGYYVIKLSYTDRSTNVMESYTSKKIVVDITKPVITTDIVTEMEVANLGAAFFVKDVHFDASKLDLKITAEDIGGNPVDVPKEFVAYLKDNKNWTTEDNLNYKIIISSLPEEYGMHSLADGIYVMTVSGTDFLGNVADTCVTPKFIVDKSAPINLDIKYSTPKLSKVISAITFNYYNAPVVVTLIAEDSTSGVKVLDWTYNKEKGSSNSNMTSDSGRFEFDSSERTATAEVRLPNGSREQYRGSISFKATDRAGNISDVYTDGKTVVVVDTVAPTRTVEFSEPKAGSFEEGGKAYYDSDAIATITITEANFYPEDVDLRVNDEAYGDINWTRSGDVWTGTVNFSSDGHYILKLNYSDRSTNKMEEYVSGEITVDEYDPEIEVLYSPAKEVYSSGERKYYSEDQIATIKITEHNFDPENVEVTLTATDIDGKEINVSGLASQLTSESAWRSEGDVHTATIKYSEDANYTFSISCTDPAGRKSAEYKPDEFTVDKTAPTDFSVDIRTNSIYEDDSTAYYNTPVAVHVSAKDAVSGIAEFNYSYTDSVSEKTGTGNAIASSTGGSGASATFKLPAEATEFNGIVKVVAIDNSGNKSNEYDNKKVIIVDSIAPVGKIELSAPVSTNGGMSYYSGNVNARITIDEANFHSEDVNIFVNGNNVSSGNWVNSGDSWSTDVVVSADGEYQISVDYADKSGNQMTRLESDRFMIDHSAPVIYVSGIKNESANNGEKIGFTLRAEDNNFKAGGFAPVLEVVKKTEGGFVTEKVDLSSAIASGNGYSIIIDNLEEDGIYTLTCVASDLCGNSSTVMTVTDSENAKTEALRFSVNRNGSAYMLDSKSDDTVKQQYIKTVNGDIVITEVNVSPVKKYSVKLNGNELVEGTDYTVEKSGGGNEWYKNVYTVKAYLFESDNEYNIVINSVDATDASYYSDIKGAEVKFVVDTTAPLITVSGVEANGEYQADKRVISIVPSDNGGLQKIRVITENSDGELIAELFNAEGDALMTELERSNGMIELETGEGINQTLRVICVDKAGNEYDSADEYSGIRISSSRMTLLFTSTGFRVGVLAAAVASACLILILIFKKKKKSKEK